MLTPEYLESIEFNKVVELYNKLNIEITADIIQRIAGLKDITSTTKDELKILEHTNGIEVFNKALETAKRVIFNGPMGLFEDNKYAKGTRMLFKCLDKNKVKTIIGGGDSAAAVNKLGFSDSFYHVSTGGGATMKYLESRSLVGIDVIEDKKVN